MNLPLLLLLLLPELPLNMTPLLLRTAAGAVLMSLVLVTSPVMASLAGCYHCTHARLVRSAKPVIRQSVESETLDAVLTLS